MTRLAQDAYLESRVLSAGPLELVRLLYRGAEEAVEQARTHLAAGEIAFRSAAIMRAVDILMELGSSLDRKRGGELAGRLAALYDYLRGRLLEANIEQRDAPLAEVLGLLKTLREAWESLGSETPVEARPSAWQVAQGDPEEAAQSWSL